MRVIGLISGTSADGIDAALCEVEGQPSNLSIRVLASYTQPYSHDLQKRVLDAALPQNSGADDLCVLNFELGEYFASAALAVVERAGLSMDAVDLIGSHGQTFWHHVDANGDVVATLQLGEAAVIAERAGVTTVSNLRARDVAAGGHGAPLASYFDWLLLRHAERWRAVQNIGGIGNVTFLPPLNESGIQPISFDTGPGNALMDTAVMVLTDDAQSYDEDGKLAAQGSVDALWLEQLLDHPYYKRKPPKTTGRELFGAQMTSELVAEGQARGLSKLDILATLTALTAESIADAYRRFAPAPIDDVIVGGGGSRNSTLLQMVRERLQPAAIITHDAVGINSDHKEAMLLALLAHETWHMRPGTQPAFTGARHPVVLGDITPGANYVDLVRKTWCDA